MTSLALCICSLFCKMHATVESSGGYKVRQVKQLRRAPILEAPLLNSKELSFHTYSISYVNSLR